MYDIVFIQPIQNIHHLEIEIAKVYDSAQVPELYPAANRSIQQRLKQFVDKGFTGNSIHTFGKVNSNRTYQLEKNSNGEVTLVVKITKGKKEGKFVVLPKQEEISLIITTVLKEAKMTGYLLTAPKCHQYLQKDYDISNKRIRLVLSTIYKLIDIVSISNCLVPAKVTDESDSQLKDHHSSSTNVCHSPMATRSKTHGKLDAQHKNGVKKRGGVGIKATTASLSNIRSLRKRKQ